jgi:hypothetical protein
VEESDDRHHLREAQGRRAVALSRLKQLFSPERFKEQAEVVYVTEQR